MRIIGNDPSTPRQAQIVASGTLPSGKPVVVNSDGTVSVVAAAAVLAVGTPGTWSSNNIDLCSSVFDSNSNKVVVVYRDRSNSFYGTAAVGTVSGTSISFGSPVVFESSNVGSKPAITFDSNSNKVVMAYYPGSTYLSTIVGTVSGTSISFGSKTNIAGAYTSWTSATFDSNSNKVIIAWQAQNNSNYGTAIVGTVNGTSISYGSAVVFESGASTYIGSAFDSNLNKVVIAYQDGGNSDYGTAIVGTVSGTSISFGTAVVFEAANSASISATFDSNSNKVVITFVDNGNSGSGTSIVGTVSGTSISFGTAAVYYQGAANSETSTAFDSNLNKIVTLARSTHSVYFGTVSGTSISFDSSADFSAGNAVQTPSIVFDSSSNKIVVSYEDDADSDKGKSTVIQVPSLNLTSENYIGIARSGAASGAGAIIDTQGAIADNLSGLTAGQSYYVQTDGTLSTTAGDPSVFAGTAVAATKLIVKG